MSFAPDKSPFPSLDALDNYEVITSPLELQTPPALSTDEQIANACYVAGALNVSIRELHRRAKHQDKRVEVDTTTGAWMPDIARAIIHGRQITIEPGGLIIASGKEPDEPGFKPGDRLSVALGRLLRDVAPRPHQISYAAVVDTTYDSIRHATTGQRNGHNFFYPRSVQRKRVLDIHSMLVNEDVIEPTDRAGIDFTIIQAADLVGRIAMPGGIISDLYNSEWGKIAKDSTGGLCFYPSDELQCITIPDRSGLGPTVQLLDQFGVPNHTTTHVQAIRDMLQEKSMLHIVGPNPDLSGVSTLLRAVNGTNQKRFHALGLRDGGWSGTTPDHYALTIARELEQHTRNFITNRKRFAEFESFDATAYAERHYSGEQALLEDQEICRIVAFALGELDIRAMAAADIGCGPNPYPGMLLLPHAAKIDLLEYAASNRDYMHGFFSGALSYNHIEMWRKFETYMTEGGGDAYVGVFDELRRAAQQQRLQLKAGDVFKLPQNTWDLLSAYFVIDSISIYQEDQHDAVASMKNALTKNGIIIEANMLNQADHIGYPAGEGQEYPNISQTAQKLKQVHLDNDLFSIVVRVRHDPNTVRDGYSGMALVFACHRDNEARVKQLQELAVKLEQRQPGSVV